MSDAATSAPGADDDAFVEKVRRRVESFDRWRWWLIVFQATVFASVLAAGVAFSWLIKSWGDLFVAAAPDAKAMFVMAGIAGLLFGLTFGGMLGMHLRIHTELLMNLLSKTLMREQRLLLRYYDQVREWTDRNRGV